MQLDLSGVIPGARPIVQAAVDVYLRHTHEWFVGLIAHGSTVKGSFIPGCSDIDLQLYLEPSAFTGDGYLPLALTLAIHYDLATINPAPFAYIKCYAHPCRLPAGQVGPIPGTYAILAGRLPIPEATAADLTRGAHDTLAAINPFLNKLTASLLEHGDGRFERHVRYLCTDVWPTLYSLLVLHSPDPLAIWRLPKEEAIALLPADEVAGQHIRAFHAALLRYYLARQSLADALAIVEHGVAFLRAARIS